MGVFYGILVVYLLLDFAQLQKHQETDKGENSVLKLWRALKGALYS